MTGFQANSGAEGAGEAGAAAAPSGSPITLVFVDLVNSTALKAAMPGGDITARNRAYFETILTPYRQRVQADLAAFGGRVVNTWGDDQFLIFLSAGHAARWATALQSRQNRDPIATPLGPLQVRIGMHTGAPLSDAGDAGNYVGHEVDYAKRVSALASGGQILLSETTAALVRDGRIAGLRLHLHGERALKGIGRAPLFELLHGGKRPQPLETAVLPQPLDVSAAGQLPSAALLDALACSRIVGRDAELGELRRRMDAALQGTGSTVFLSGEPGIGKTRLASEAALYARLLGFQVLMGRCDEEGTAAYQPLAEAMREYLNSAEPARLEGALPPPVACELVRIVPTIASKLKDVPQVPPLPAEQARQALLEAAQQFFAYIATHEAPLLLFLDDLHWADEGGLALLHALARQAKNLRLVVIGTYRDMELDTRHPLERALAAMNRERVYQRLSLRRLPEAGVAEMVASLLDVGHERSGGGHQSSAVSRNRPVLTDGREPGHHAVGDADGPTPMAAFVAALYHETEGNPFFIEEVLKHLVEEGAIFCADGRWQIKPVEELSIPQSIKVAIGRRLERLSEESREALTLAAVIGQQFSFELLLQASEREEERLLKMLDEWLGAHLVIEERREREELYRFQHALIREVLYDEPTLRRRARLHERVGEALEAVYEHQREEHLDELAYHFSQLHSGTAVEKGIDYCLRAGEKARQLDANEAAIQHLTAALELLEGLAADEPHLRQRWEVVAGLARAYSACRAFERAQEVLQEYLALAQRASYAWGMAAAHGEMATALHEAHRAAGIETAERSRGLRVEHLERSLQIAERHGLTDWRARARTDLAQHLCDYGTELPRAEELLREKLQAPEGLAREDVRATYGMLMRACALQGKWDAVAAALRQSIPFGEPSFVLGFSLGPMEEALEGAGRHAEFVAFCEEAKALCAQAGLPLPLNQWYLQPTTASEELLHLLFRDDFEAPEIRPQWQWHDPVHASSYSLSDRPGFLTLRAGLGVDLFPYSNLNAPRMLLEVSGDFALETKMEGNWDERNEMAQSGLLVWKDALNFLRLEKFSMDHWNHGSIQFEGRIRGEYRIVGRGLLRGINFHLRLERTGERFAALCSTDGAHWLTCGQVIFPVKDPLLVGVSALHGMVVHFDYVQVLGREDQRPR
jgi:class 3 adenylate cyclase/regulation of enolase protein 1 (concanavalin A-like superfamily)